jgi:hypothetical protein
MGKQASMARDNAARARNRVDPHGKKAAHQSGAACLVSRREGAGGRHPPWRLEEGDSFLQEIVTKGKVLYEKPNRRIGAKESTN